MHRRLLSVVVLAAPCIALLASAPARAASCTSLTSLTLPHATVTLAQSVPAGSFTAPNGQVLTDLPAFCRVAVVSRPSPDSQIGLEVWLPRHPPGTGNTTNPGMAVSPAPCRSGRWLTLSGATMPRPAPTTGTSAGPRPSLPDTT